MPKCRKVIVNIGTSADGFIARRDGDLEWLTSRPAPKGFYGMGDFVKSIDTKVLGRNSYEASLRLGAKFEPPTRYIVFSRQPRPADAPLGVEFVITVAPVFVGDGIPLITRRHRHVPLELRSVEQFENGVIQVRYRAPSST